MPKATLYAWLRLAGGRSVGGAVKEIHMGKSKGRKRSPTQKLKLLAKSIELEGEALTEFCRVNQFLLSEAMAWRDQALSGLEMADSPRGLVPREQLQDLEKELTRKNSVLAELSALLVLSKKVSRLFEEEK